MVAILSFVSFLFARIHCENLDRYGYENLTEDAKLQLVNSLKQKLEAEYRNECIAKGGKGSAFTIHSGRVVKVCADISGSASGYLRVEMLCDYCTGKKMNDKLKAIEEDCKNGCMESVAYCQKPDLIYEGGWGGKIVNDDECGETLPECLSEGSSSSETVESSSSEELSSSSEYIESSSSEDPESSSSEEKIDSSSSDGDDDESSSSGGGEECGTGTGHCPVGSSSSDVGPYKYVENIDPCEGYEYAKFTAFRYARVRTPSNEFFNKKCIHRTEQRKLPRYALKPGYYGNLNFGVQCYLNYYNLHYVFVVKTNVPYVYFESSPYVYCHYDSYECERWLGTEIKEEIPSFYYCMDRNYSQGNYDSEQGCYVTKAENGIWIGTNDFTVSSLITDVEHWDFFNYEGEFPSNYSLQQLIREPEVVAEFEKCKEEFRQFLVSLESSSSAESSSSSEETESSSSNETESSSSLGDDESSSSVLVESSSSEFVYSSSDDGVFVAGGDQVHSPDQIIRDGLDNMEPGSCYSLNPARGTQYGWMNTDAKDSWWWREVDCETGEKVDRNRVGACPGFPLDNVPGNPKNACFAYNGTCYKCNPDRGSECSNSWLWQGTFTSANVGWWYEKVDCDNPFEEDFDGQCPDRFYLEKSVADNHDYFEIKNYTVEYSVSQKDYDALGRRLNGTRSKFLRTFKKRENKIAPISNNTFDVGSVIYIPIEKMGLSQKFLAKQDDQCTDYSCGNLGIDYGIGNDIGVYCGYLCTKLNMENGFLRVEVKEKVQTGSCGENNPKYTITFKLPATATIKRKNIYYVAPIGYKMGDRVVTKDDYEAVERHEKGHMKSYSCLEDKKMFKSEYEFELEGVCEKEFTCNKNGVIKGLAQKIKDSVTVQKGTGIDALIKYNKNLWQKMCGWYHKNFSRYDGPGGPKNPKDIDCPTTETLLKGKYDLTGCEVLE